MTISWLALAATFFILGGAAWLNGRIKNLPAMRDAPPEPHREPPLPDEVRDYLDRVDVALDLPSADRVEIRAELADHLVDSIAAIKVEGFDDERATGEALARLGRADELARQMQHAHRTTRRALAGVGGGVFEAGVGAIQGVFLGTLVGLLLFFGLAVLVTTVLKAPIDQVAARLPSMDTDSNALAFNSAFVAAIYAFAAWMAARRGTATTWRLSRQAAARVRSCWAVGGGVLLTLFVVFVYSAQQSWLAVVFELSIPVAFVVGAYKFDWRIRRIPNLAWVSVLLATIVLPMLMLAFSTGYSSGSGSVLTPLNQTAEQAALDRVAPLWPGSAPSTNIEGIDLNLVGANQMTGMGIDRAALAQLRDVHLEVWRARPDGSGELMPDQTYSSPYATYALPSPTNADGGIDINLSKVKPHDSVIFVIGTAPDGRRYRLNATAVPWAGWFSGTVWDWLTAGD